MDLSSACHVKRDYASWFDRTLGWMNVHAAGSTRLAMIQPTDGPDALLPLSDDR
jgi:hypothetical protein